MSNDIIERAAAAAWNLKANRSWAEIPEEWKPFYRDQMRAALGVIQPLVIVTTAEDGSQTIKAAPGDPIAAIKAMPAGGDEAVDKLCHLMQSFDAGDSMERPRIIAHDECYTMSPSMCRRFARQTVDSIRRNEVPGLHMHPTEADGADSADVLTMLAERTADVMRLQAELDNLKRDQSRTDYNQAQSEITGLKIAVHNCKLAQDRAEVELAAVLDARAAENREWQRTLEEKAAALSELANLKKAHAAEKARADELAEKDIMHSRACVARADERDKAEARVAELEAELDNARSAMPNDPRDQLAAARESIREHMREATAIKADLAASREETKVERGINFGLKTDLAAMTERAEQAAVLGGETQDALKQECAEHNATKGALQAALERAGISDAANAAATLLMQGARAEAEALRAALRELWYMRVPTGMKLEEMLVDIGQQALWQRLFPLVEPKHAIRAAGVGGQ